MKCLVVDDEPIARNILETYISRMPSLRLVASLDNALEVFDYLKSEQVDLMFLDINMPEFTGIELLKSMRNPPAVIITTAYAEYGAESYDYDVADYLMKPFPFERFLKAIQKVENQRGHDGVSDKSFLFLKEDNTLHKVAFADIRYVQAYGNYIKVFLHDDMRLVRKTIGQIEEELGGNFLRVHKSYLVAFSAIQGTEGNEVILTGNHRLPVGKVYKKGLQSWLHQGGP